RSNLLAGIVQPSANRQRGEEENEQRQAPSGQTHGTTIRGEGFGLSLFYAPRRKPVKGRESEERERVSCLPGRLRRRTRKWCITAAGCRRAQAGSWPHRPRGGPGRTTSDATGCPG